MVSVGIDFSGGIRSDSFALREDPGRFGRGGLPDREQECQAVILAEATPVLLPGPGSPWCDPQRGGPFGPLCRRQHSRQPQFLNWESSSSGLSRKVGHPDTGREDAGEKLRRVMFMGWGRWSLHPVSQRFHPSLLSPSHSTWSKFIWQYSFFSFLQL